MKLTGGAVLISVVDGEEKLYSERMACVNCGINVPPLEPRSFSFNSAYGACKRCHGLGTVLEDRPGEDHPRRHRARRQARSSHRRGRQAGRGLPEERARSPSPSTSSADSQTPFAELPRQVRDAFFHGVEGQITFRQGLYKYESDWKGAVRTSLRERDARRAEREVCARRSKN